MDGKITLITPPDFYENDSLSILFMHLSKDQDQEAVSRWLVEHKIKENINIYFYDEGTNVDWLLYAAARCDFKFINLDLSNEISKRLSGYLLGKKNFFYQTEDKNLFALYQYINQNRVSSVEKFLEYALSDKFVQYEEK